MNLKKISDMATLVPWRTGLNQELWISGKPKSQHKLPRLKVSSDKGSFVLSIEDEPKILAGHCNISSKDLNKIIQFIILNKEVLLNHWNNASSYDIGMVIENLKKISDSANIVRSGNLNDYVAVINKVNLLEDTNLTVEDFNFLTEIYPDTTFSVKYGPKDSKANATIEAYPGYFINFYFV